MIQIASTGSLIVIRRNDAGAPPPPKDSPVRGCIKDWSRKSRMKLKVEMAKLDREALASSVFVTLTYPGEFPAPDDHKTYKNHLRVFFQRLVREQGRDLAGFWKLEFQKRNAAHYHILLTGFRGDIVEFRKWLAKTWYDVVGSGDPDHFKAGTGADPARSVQGAMSYLAKYIAKDTQTRPGNFTGRYWGKFNRAALPLSETETLDIQDPADVTKLTRWARRIIVGHVMETRWKLALFESGDWMSPSDGWTRTAAETALTGVNVMTVTKKDRFRKWSGLDGRSTEKIPEGAVIWSKMSGDVPLKPPRKFRLGGRGAVSLIVNTEHFRSAIMRAQVQGILSLTSATEVTTARLGFRAISKSWDKLNEKVFQRASC